MTPEQSAALESENKRLKDGNEWLMEEMQRQLDFQVSDKNHIEKLESENKELKKQNQRFLTALQSIDPELQMSESQANRWYKLWK